MGYVISELKFGRFFKDGEQRISLKTVSYSGESINTMGGIKIVPDCLIEDIVLSETSMLLLPGAGTLNEPKDGAIIEKAREFLTFGATVCAISGATATLANFGLIDKRHHTRNGPGYLEMVSPGYQGQDLYIDKPSVADTNLITACSCGGWLWVEHLGVFKSNTLESWYEYFSTGEPKHYIALMQTLPSRNEN